jgi:hypothetical protein
MTEKELAKELRAFRAERRQLEREVASMEAEKPAAAVTLRLGTREEAAAALRALLLEALEADERP